MEFREHVQITGGALKRWLLAQTYDSLAVAALWLVGLLVLRVPLAPLWAALAFVFQFVPHFGPVMTFIGPSVAGAISGGFERFIYVLILYAVAVVLDGFVFQPMFMKRTARVPIWASLLAPLVVGLFLGFWWVLLVAPVLAIIYAYRERKKHQRPDVEILPPEHRYSR